MVKTNVIPIDLIARLRILIKDWRRLEDVREIKIRYRAISQAQAMGTRLPADVHDAWLQMSAIVTIAEGRA